MKNFGSLTTKILTGGLLILVLVGCSPAKNPTSQATQAIQGIRNSLELPDLPLEYMENTEMANSPSGGLEVANYRDSAGRIYSVDLITNRVVEIDARAILANISADTPALSADAIQAKAMAFAHNVEPDFDSLQSSLEYEAGGKIDNYFFTWYGAMLSGGMNRPFLQFGFHKSGALFTYINTLSVEK